MNWITKAYNWFCDAPNVYGGYWLNARSPTAHFFYREVWHFLGGAIVGTFAFLCSFWASDSVRIWIFASFGGILFGTIIGTETRDGTTGQKRYKTFLDLLFWFAGFAMIVTLTQ